MLTPFPNLTILDIPIGNSPQIVMAIVAVLISSFILFCFIPALVTWWRLKSARGKLNNIHRNKQSVLIEKEDLSAIFKSALFQEAWNTFKDTLHEQHDYQAGIQQITNIRATAPAEAFFSQQTLVDSRINIEFFKHLPGILTGIGIIGTFWGLIHGIQSFDPSLLAKARLDPAQMDLLFNGLKQLFLEVQGAFIASAVAIFAAMLITLIEKVSINACYYRLEQLCLKLDALYEGGIAEVYLAALVKSSAENVTHTAQLKASLVTELSELLRELTDKQIKQSEVFATMLADKLTGKIQEQMDATANHGELFRTELKNGLEDMGDKVAKIAGGQGDTVTGMLEQLIEKFSGTISSTFNEQMQGIGGMINQAATSMQTTQAGFDGLIKDLRDTGVQERQAANEQMLQLMTAIDNRQETSQAQMQGFIDAINAQISNAQQNNAEQIRDSLNEIQLSTRQILADIKQDRINARAEEQKQQELFADAMSSKFTEQMKKIGSMFMHTSSAMQTMQGGFETLMTDLRDTGTQERQTVQENLTELQTSTQKILADMEGERAALLEAERDRQQAFVDSAHALISNMESQISALAKQVGDTMSALKDNTIELNNASDKMTVGAEQISQASTDFAAAGDKVSGVIGQTEKLSTQLMSTGKQMSSAADVLETQLKDYTATRELLGRMISDMETLLNRAKQESGMNQQIVADMQKMVGSFGVLKNDMDDFVKQVSGLLAETLTKFQNDMATHNTEFHKHHADTLKQVANAYQPLSASISGLIDMFARTNNRGA